MYFNDLRWMVGLLVEVKWNVVGFSVWQVRAVRQVKGDVKEITIIFFFFFFLTKVALCEFYLPKT